MIPFRCSARVRRPAQSVGKLGSMSHPGRPSLAVSDVANCFRCLHLPTSFAQQTRGKMSRVRKAVMLQDSAFCHSGAIQSGTSSGASIPIHHHSTTYVVYPSASGSNAMEITEHGEPRLAAVAL